MLTDPGTKGKLEFFVTSTAPAGVIPTASRADASHYMKVANETAVLNSDSSGATPAASMDVTNAHPVQTINFDGTSPRASVDFTPTSGTVLLARWTPDTAGQPLNIREINTFGDVALNDYELAPPPVSEGPSKDAADSKGGGGKEAIPPVGSKETIPPVGEGAPTKTPFLPGVPPFPPTIPNVPVSPPTQPAST